MKGWPIKYRVPFEQLLNNSGLLGGLLTSVSSGDVLSSRWSRGNTLRREDASPRCEQITGLCNEKAGY